jgi:hypothetical protein
MAWDIFVRHNDAKNPATGVPPPMGSLEKIGVELWQHDLWWHIVTSALSGNPDRVNRKFHAALDKPAVSRYGATTPKLLRWFDAFDDGQSYAKHVKPFGFLYSLFAKGLAELDDSIEEFTAPAKSGGRTASQCRPVAPYDKDLAKATKRAFDRETRLSVPVDALKSYKEIISLYHLHPELKFKNGEAFDRGVTQRRFVRAIAFRNIGKEANE